MDIIYALPSLVMRVKEGLRPSYINYPLPLAKGKGKKGIGFINMPAKRDYYEVLGISKNAIILRV